MANPDETDGQRVSCDEIDSTEKDQFCKPDSRSDISNPSQSDGSCVTSNFDRCNSEDDHRDEKKQKSSKSDANLSSHYSNNSANIASVSASPPRFMALEEIMKAANDVYNMCLAHEIAVDEEFKLEKQDPPPNTLHKRVDEMMRKAFWDLLQNELDESPPNYKRALVLLAEIKENLMSFLLPQHTRLKQEIDEILDLDLIKKQAENGALDFQRYAHYVLSVMARLCAPLRDEKIRQLTQTREVVPLFR